MKFRYQDSVYINEYELDTMCNLCKEGHSIVDAINIVIARWDNYNYYKVICIEDQLIEEIEHRLAQEKTKVKD